MLKSEADLHDVKRQDVETTWWAFSKCELVVWALIVLGVPVLFLAARFLEGHPESSLEVRVEEHPGLVHADDHGNTHVRLDLNAASTEELVLLPGIGPSRARDIVERRTKKGPYRSIWDLTQIRGISKQTVERLAPLIEVMEAPESGTIEP